MAAIEDDTISPLTFPSPYLVRWGVPGGEWLLRLPVLQQLTGMALAEDLFA